MFFRHDFVPAADGSGDVRLVDSAFVEAMRNGWLVMIDEVNVARDVALLSINSCLDGRLSLYLPSTGETVTATDHFAVVIGALAAHGWTLRSGGAMGADHDRRRRHTELFLPWARFQQTALAKLGAPTRRLTGASEAAFALAGTFHPVWQRLPDTVKALHARNCHQVLGAWLDSPADRVICWTPDGSLDGSSGAAGGTGQALRIAAAHGIAVVNLALDEHRDRLQRFVDTAAER
jgi:hypothetical protein